MYTKIYTYIIYIYIYMCVYLYRYVYMYMYLQICVCRYIQKLIRPGTSRIGSSPKGVEGFISFCPPLQLSVASLLGYVGFGTTEVGRLPMMELAIVIFCGQKATSA